ncbi:hypothetical protein FIBSPDRAFT_871074 [Athelia psychrophila]|uniref:Uncharacterized protein n=1 Tax=Athelia psychrophila TaxID=1759441 RepID=A0A166AJV1_9AGAM|nr:hypothetical protein FIBSPDRAFT_871074 [Fibularhizoctonia sp. CBS 109695]
MRTAWALDFGVHSMHLSRSKLSVASRLTFGSNPVPLLTGMRGPNTSTPDICPLLFWVLDTSDDCWAGLQKWSFPRRLLWKHLQGPASLAAPHCSTQFL